MKVYINAETVPAKELSKERLETIVEQIVTVINKPELGGSRQLLQIIKILEFYKLR